MQWLECVLVIHKLLTAGPAGLRRRVVEIEVGAGREVVLGPGAHDIGVVNGGRNRNRTRRASVHVTKRERQLLDRVCREIIFINKNIIMCWTAGSQEVHRDSEDKSQIRWDA